MDQDKMKAFRAVVRMLGQESTHLTDVTAEQALRDLYDHLHERSLAALERDEASADALSFSRQYLAFAEMVIIFGTTLIALDDIERETLGVTDGGEAGTN